MFKGGCTMHIIAPEKSDSALIFFHCTALQALTLWLSQALLSPNSVLLVPCSGPSNNFLYGSHYSRDGHYHLGNRFPLQLLQKDGPSASSIDIHRIDYTICDMTETESGVNLNSKWW